MKIGSELVHSLQKQTSLSARSMNNRTYSVRAKVLQPPQALLQPAQAGRVF